MPETANDVDLSVVVPVFEEEGSLAPLDAEIHSTLAGLDGSSEIVYVDDGSRDRTLEVLRSLATKAAGGPVRVRVVQLRRNFGQTAALAAGFDLARGRVIVPLDADGQNDPADIPRLLAELDRGFDVVSGWRHRREDRALSRRFPSQVANWLLGRLTGLQLHDYGCTLKAYRAEHLREVRLYGDMHRFIPAYLARMGARTAELEVNHRPRTTGSSKYGARRVVRVALDMVLIRFMTRYYTKPMQFFGHTALALLAATGWVLLTMLAFKFGWLRVLGIDYQASFIQTPLPALAASLLVGSLMSLFFGILAEVLIRIHHESQGLNAYAIERVHDSDA